jgi:hypothetical protein
LNARYDFIATQTPERGQTLGELKSTDTPPANVIETMDERQTRLTTRTLEQLRLNNQLLALAGSGDPEFLADSMEASFLRDSPDRARAIAAVIVGRLRTLAADGTISGANAAYVGALSRYSNWSAKNPSAITRLRRIDEQLRNVEQPIRQMHAKLRSYFRWGKAAFGQRM